MNIHIQQDYTARAEAELISTASNFISPQASKPNILIVQDSLLACYLLTRENVQISKDKFFNICLALFKDKKPMSSNYILNRISYIEKILKEKGKDTNPYTGRGLFSMILPTTFHLSTETVPTIGTSTTSILEIYRGVIIDGCINKIVVKDVHNAIQQLFFKEYNVNVAIEFIDNVQLLTREYMLMRGYSIGIEDCIVDNSVKDKINNTLKKAFLQASSISESVSNEKIRESKVFSVLNSARDSSMKIVKDNLKPTNGFVGTIISGSKGDYRNICEISSALGQQCMSGNRMKALFNNGKRSLPHYPLNIQDISMQYESRGFVSSSFIKGLNPREFLWHSISGREGLSDTAVKTGDSGYVQRKMVKISEDVQVKYDNTVRNSIGNIIQWCYADDGLDRSQTVVLSNKKVSMCDVKRIVRSLNVSYVTKITRYNKSSSTLDLITLDEDDAEAILHFIKPNPGIPEEIGNSIVKNLKKELSLQLINLQTYTSLIPTISLTLNKIYVKSLVQPGESVGILMSMSIGERQTQITLRSFHSTGKSIKTIVTGVPRFTELINATTKPKNLTSRIYFLNNNDSILDLRNSISTSLLEITLSTLYIDRRIVRKDDTFYVIYTLDLGIMFEYKISLKDIKNILEERYDVKIDCSPNYLGTLTMTTLEPICQPLSLQEYIIKSDIEKTVLFGIKGIKKLYYEKDDKKWIVEAEFYEPTPQKPCVYMDILGHSLVDSKNTVTNNVWDIYKTLGLEAARRFLVNELLSVISSDAFVNKSHVQLLVDIMTYSGTIQSISRYSLNKERCGPLAKASFEESVNNLLKAGAYNESENTNGVSASIMLGKLSRIGTGLCDVLYDDSI